MAVVNVIAIHGMGKLRRERTQYSLPLQRNIRKHFGVSDPNALKFWEVNWSDIGEAEERDLIENKNVLPDASVPGAGALWPPHYVAGELVDSVLGVSEQVRRFLFTHIGDVFVYLTDEGGSEISQRLLDKIQEVRTAVMDQYPERDQHYVSIVAHSLGSVITYDVAAYLGDERPEEVAGLGLSHLFTFGSPLALFSLLNYGGDAPNYQRRGVLLDRLAVDGTGEWLNFYDQQDPLAFPLKDVYPPQPDIPKRNFTIQDIRVQTGTFRAHTGYFGNDVIAREIAKRLRADYEKDKMA